MSKGKQKKFINPEDTMINELETSSISTKTLVKRVGKLMELMEMKKNKGPHLIESGESSSGPGNWYEWEIFLKRS